MIRLHVSAVLCVADGFSGRPVSKNAVRCFVNGQPFVPEYRQGGYLVFVNLAPGECEIRLRGAYYQDEIVLLTVGERPQTLSVSLKPAANYPFPQQVTELSLSFQKEGKILWVASAAPGEQLRLAQESAAAGEDAARVFFRGAFRGSFPQNYLIADGEKSEIVTLTAMEEERAVFEAPLRFSHSRSTAFCPAQAYRAGKDGRALAVFRAAGTVFLFDPEEGILQELALCEGKNQWPAGAAERKGRK